MNAKYYLLIMVPVLVLSACSQQPDSKQAEAQAQQEPTHVWREKTDTLNQADAVNQILLDSAANRMQQAEADSR